MRRTVVVGAVGVLAAGLAGCSVSPGSAAVVDGRTISQAYLEQSQQDLAPLLSDPTPASVLSVLVVAPTFIEAAADGGVGVSRDEALTLLAESAAAAGLEPLPDFGEGAVEVALFSLALQNLQSLDEGDQVVADLQDAAAALDVQVNPRYGELDPVSGQISAVTPPWIRTATP